jgi:hypothetical protein
MLFLLFIYPLHLKMQDSAGIRNAFRQGIDCRVNIAAKETFVKPGSG